MNIKSQQQSNRQKHSREDHRSQVAASGRDPLILLTVHHVKEPEKRKIWNMKYLKSGNKEEELKAPCYRRVNTHKRKRKTVKQPHRDTDGNTPADTPQLPTDYLQIIYRLPIDYFQIIFRLCQIIYRLSTDYLQVYRVTFKNRSLTPVWSFSLSLYFKMWS